MIRIEPLGAGHDRANFRCGEQSLDVFLHRFARQNMARGVGVTYVAVEDEAPTRVLGYYTLSSSAIAREQVPEAGTEAGASAGETTKLPRYPVPAALIGRLAVDQEAQGRGIGLLLMLDALARVVHISQEMGIHAVEVVALHERARAFYERLGFLSLQNDPLHLFLPLSTARALLAE